jgi:hypothetical protein
VIIEFTDFLSISKKGLKKSKRCGKIDKNKKAAQGDFL